MYSFAPFTRRNLMFSRFSFQPLPSFGPPTPPPSLDSDVGIEMPVRRSEPALPFGYYPNIFPLVAGEALDRLRQLETQFQESKYRHKDHLHIAV